MKDDTFRTVIGFALILLILVGWQMLFRPRPRPVVPAAPATEPAPVESAPTPPKAAPAAILPETGQPAARPQPAFRETTYVLENARLRLEISSLGGAVRSARLKRYDAELVPDGAALFGLGLLTPAGYLPPDLLPMDAVVDDTSLVLNYSSGEITLTRTLTLTEDYQLEDRLQLNGTAGIVVDATAGLAITEKDIREALAHYHYYRKTRQKLHQLQAGRLKKPDTGHDSMIWVGLKSKYFLGAVAADGVTFDSVWASALPDHRAGFSAVISRPAADTRLRFFFAPLEIDLLRSYRLGMEQVVGLGWTRPIALAMLWLLKFLYRILSNWGLAIVVFSIMMKALFWPLTRTQTRQMRQMQLLQPKLNELKVRYKNDPQKLNAETMQLYKLYRVNPLSGCLPLLVQLPVFWALYAVLRNSIDLRGAAFVLWLNDLSRPDALFGHLPNGLPFVGGAAFGVLPLLMGVSFIAQNLITSTDKRNWAMTVIFPVFITLIFLNMPSGLQLYWFMYNILSIIETVIGTKGVGLWQRKTRTATAPPANPN